MNESSLIYSRRKFFKFGLIPLLAISAGLQTGCDKEDKDQLYIEKRLIGTLHHLDKAREIGKTYKFQDQKLKQLSADKLTEEILLWLNLNREKIGNLSDKKLNKLLSKQIRKDFTDENVVTLGTWMFAKTEMLLCVLAASYPDI